MTYTLHAPGTRSRKSWVARGRVGDHTFEISCRTTEKAQAEHVALAFVANLQAELDRRSPRARNIGAFEQWLLDNFYWSEGLVLRRNGGIVRFHAAAQGYRSTKLTYNGESKTVLEHRVVFLLVNGWLPESIDHKNRDRGDNRPSNLVASTPHSQAGNRGKIRTKLAQPAEMQ